MGIDVGPIEVTDGLVFQIDAGNLRSYSGSGITVNALAGSGVTLLNGVGFGTTNVGRFIFDGSNDFIPIGSLGTFYTQGTISFWMNSSDVSASIRNPFSTNYGIASNINVLRYETAETSGSLRCWLGDPSGNVQGLFYSNIATNTWYNVVVTWNQSTTTVSGFLNGNPDVSNSSWIRWPSTFANLALGIGYTNRYFIGNISQLHIYNRALSATEILQNYNTTKGRYGL